MNGYEPSASQCRLRGRTAWIGLTLAGIAAIVLVYLLVDAPMMQWLLDHRIGWHRNFWVDGFRQLGKATVPIWLLLVWSCLTNRWRATAVTVGALILVGISVGPLKVIAGRSRPYVLATASQAPESEGRSVPWQKRVSFPSGDAAVAFSIATTLFLLGSRLAAPALFTAAGGIGLLRVTAFAHYPSDVLAGALIGILCGGYAVRGMTRLPWLDGFRLRWPGRLVVVLVLILVALLPLPLSEMKSLHVFLNVSFIPLSALALVGGVAWKGGKWISRHRMSRLNGATSESKLPGQPMPQKS